MATDQSNNEAHKNKQQRDEQHSNDARTVHFSNATDCGITGSIRNTVGVMSEAFDFAPSGEAVPRGVLIECTTTTTTHPGAIHVRGWDARNDDDSSSQAEATTSFSRLGILSAQLVDEEEIQHHAESLFQQMLAQAAVAELVDEQEMRQRAAEQAVLEFQQKKQADDAVTQEAINKQLQKKRRFIAVCFFFLTVIVIAFVVVVTTVFLEQQGAEGGADLTSSSPLPSTTPSVFPSLSPSTAPSAMPSAASSWRQIGNSINGIEKNENFGMELQFSADGNTVVATADITNFTHPNITIDREHQVRAYSYHNETDEWKQLGQFISLGNEYSNDNLRLSPNGRFLGLISQNSYPPSSHVYVFALRVDNKTNINATMTEDAEAAILWEQIGHIVYNFSDLFITDASLTDNLILAILGDTYDGIIDHGLVHIYQIDANQSNWVRMGQEIQMIGSSIQLVRNKRTGMLVLAVGGTLSAKIYHYHPEYDWTFASELIGDDSANYDGTSSASAALMSLSMDGETIIVGVERHAYGNYSIRLLRSFSYDEATDGWIRVGKDLIVSSFIFGKFSLSANGKVLVATTQKIGITSHFFTWQVRTFDFIANDAGGGGGEWIQRGAALEVDAPESAFGYYIALSADGNRLATSAIYASTEQDVETGTVRVFEQY